MFQTIDIKAYRGLKNITLQNLSRVNILVGENNTGKTSILEAILFSGTGRTKGYSNLCDRL